MSELRLVDLRSDTVTKPTAAMRAAMAAAEVGDDVFGDDPTVNALQERIAAMLGKQAALFVPSGTQSNLCALMSHCQRGDEALVGQMAHLYRYEAGGMAVLGSIQPQPLPQQPDGTLALADIEAAIKPDDEHFGRTRLLCLENTWNGQVLAQRYIEDATALARRRGLACHLDGARLFNAVVATGIAAEEWSRHFDTVSVCFSKGLGAPVGSALAGPRDLIKEARRHRKLFGGGMRQVGIIAAGALFALRHNRERLAADHAHARLLAAAVRASEGLTLQPEQVDTNIVIFRVEPAVATAAEFVAALESDGVRTMAVSATQIRLVTHLDVSEADVRKAAQVIEQVAARFARRAAR